MGGEGLNSEAPATLSNFFKMQFNRNTKRLFVVATIFGGLFLSVSALNDSMDRSFHEKMTKRYQSLAVRTLGQRALLSFKHQSRGPGDKQYHQWLQKDAPCIKFSGYRFVERDGSGRLEGEGLASTQATCGDFFVTTPGTQFDRSELPEICLPVFETRHSESEATVPVFLAVSHQDESPIGLS